MTDLSKFYDHYHQKNNRYQALIGPRNFTYFYILELFKLAGLENWSKKKVLDVGCGVGTLSLYCADKGANVEGVDVSKRAIQIAQAAQTALSLSNVTFKRGQLKKGQPFYDRVLCFEVIEHIQNEKSFLAAIHSQLKPKGTLILSTPSSANFLYKTGFYFEFDHQVGHLRRYTVETISEVLETAGFKIIKIREVEGPLRNLLFTTKAGFLIRGIRGPLLNLFHFLDRISGKILGYTDIQVVARKI